MRSMDRVNRVESYARRAADVAAREIYNGAFGTLDRLETRLWALERRVRCLEGMERQREAWCADLSRDVRALRARQVPSTLWGRLRWLLFGGQA